MFDAGSPQGPALSAAPRPTVVLACSGPEAGAIVEVARALIADGVRVDVVAGVDLDSRPIELALEQHSGNTLWVLCRSEHLDEYQLELLLLTVRASEVPEEHVIALPYDQDASSTFVALVRRRLTTLAWIGAEPEVPAPRREPTVPTLAPDASGLDDVPRSRPGGRIIGAALAIATSLSVGGWWWGSSAAEASDLRVEASPVATARVAELLADADAEDDAEPQPQPQPEVAARLAALSRGAPMPAAPRIAETRAPHEAPPSIDDTAEEGESEPVAAAVLPKAPVFDAESPLGRALADREIRALDALLVATQGTPTTARRARKQCGRLDVAGVEAWRLPEPEELGALAEAGFLPHDSRYWTRRGKKSKRARVSRDRVRTRFAPRRAEATVLCVALADA